MAPETMAIHAGSTAMMQGDEIVVIMSDGHTGNATVSHQALSHMMTQAKPIKHCLLVAIGEQGPGRHARCDVGSSDAGVRDNCQVRAVSGDEIATPRHVSRSADTQARQ
ncbi:hypothetical protein LQ948_15800 [Jiella sp. MQZ9-1]|uniref:Uncharacterized protein n=1 Tax=Jiella flava TaxID=2816857 RepID=A0A939JTK7_9HYPH|nr:hypothetical protein [Jiella flava]MBO0664098.1 hypothetical protein [Jiella flava]MCD2472669.1 hypothetical protein [Jiella flava]